MWTSLLFKLSLNFIVPSICVDLKKSQGYSRDNIISRISIFVKRRRTYCRFAAMLFVAQSIDFRLKVSCAAFPTSPLRGYAVSQSTLCVRMEKAPTERRGRSGLFWWREFKLKRTL